MFKVSGKREKRAIRHRRVRSRVFGVAARPRLSCFRSNRHIFLQLIDDGSGRTLFAASDLELKKKGTLTERAFLTGALLAKKAAEKGVGEVVFDRGGYSYHGAVKAAADGARKGGLKF